MAKIFIGIALVVMLATAVLGFMTKGRIDELQVEKQKTKTALNKTEGDLHVKVGELKKSQEDLASTKSALDEKEKEVTAKVAQIDDLTKKVADAATQLETTSKELADIKEKMKPGPDGPKPAIEDPEKVALKERAEKAEVGLAEAKQIQETLNRKIKDNDSRLAALEQYKRTREREIMRPGISGRVLAVNPGWNFVVLSIGDKQGLINNAPMLVMRGGEAIAKIRVTSIEPSQSIADVIPGSLRKGVSVQPGDNVVFEGARNQMPKGQMPAASAAGTETPAAPALPSIAH